MMLNKIKQFCLKQICKIDPRIIANKAYKSVFGEDIDWDIYSRIGGVKR